MDVFPFPFFVLFVLLQSQFCQVPQGASNPDLFGIVCTTVEELLILVCGLQVFVLCIRKHGNSDMFSGMDTTFQRTV